MNRLFPLTAALFAAATAHAEPYCANLLREDTLPKKYAKSAPVYSDTGSGWVFTKDQLKDRYDMKSSSQELVQAIVDEFAKRDVQLAIMVAPPRPVVAGQAQLDTAMGDVRYDVGAARASFDALLAGLAKTGAIVPNLSDAALADPALREDFYFQRDTHWTPTGAAVSAIELARLVNALAPDRLPNDGSFGVADLRPSGTIEENGSLAGLVRSVCGTDLDIETATSFDLTRSGGLLDDTAEGPAIALVGSSFSARYKRDHYRFGDALARAFDAEIENYSVSGGGPIGAIEAYVLSGALDRGEHPLVIWELPYTESFNSVSFLRQLLGALQRDVAPVEVAHVEQSAQSVSIKVDANASLSGIEITSGDLSNQSFRLQVRFDNGSTSKLSLSRRSSVPAEMRTASLYSSLKVFGHRTPVEIVISAGKGATIAGVGVF